MFSLIYYMEINIFVPVSISVLSTETATSVSHSEDRKGTTKKSWGSLDKEGWEEVTALTEMKK